MQCMKRVTHLTSNITTNPLWNVCSQDRCQKKYIKDSYWKTSHLQLWINQLSRLFSQLSGNLCIGLDSDTYNYLLSTLTFCDKETYQHLSAPNIPIFCDKEYFRAYQHKSSMISSGIKDFLSWLSLSSSMKTFIKISGPIYMSFSPSVSWTRECRIQAKKLINSLIFLCIEHWPMANCDDLLSVFRLVTQALFNNRAQQWTQNLLAILTFFVGIICQWLVIILSIAWHPSSEFDFSWMRPSTISWIENYEKS